MKNLIGASLLLLITVGCNSKTSKTEISNSETTDTTVVAPSEKTTAEEPAKEQLYACPMHPEVTGKKGEKCSKCGMELTEPVAK